MWLWRWLTGNIDFTTFSETEQVVGVWTNGKTIYRRVVDSGALTGDSNILYDAFTGASELISTNGYWINGTNNSQTSFNATFAVGGPIIQSTRALLYPNDGGKVRLQFTQVDGTVPSTVRFIVAIEYTKSS